MNEREGVIKYVLEHRSTDLPNYVEIEDLIAWRQIFYRLQLIGQTPDKYDGLGYGNISRRLLADSQQFLISGTQTGHLQNLNREHFALVEKAWPEQNRINSQGLSRPSSEALTHASVYQQDATIQSVIHVHSPVLWQNTQYLQLQHTAANIPYGTPAMAQEVAKLFRTGQLATLGIFSMLGHEDGIIAFGPSLETAATLLIAQLAKAFVVEQSRQAR